MSPKMVENDAPTKLKMCDRGAAAVFHEFKAAKEHANQENGYHRIFSDGRATEMRL